MSRIVVRELEGFRAPTQGGGGGHGTGGLSCIVQDTLNLYRVVEEFRTEDFGGSTSRLARRDIVRVRASALAERLNSEVTL